MMETTGTMRRGDEEEAPIAGYGVLAYPLSV